MPTLPKPPWTMWLVVALTICATVYQYPHWRVPAENQPVFLAAIIAIVTALSLGVLYGGRWAFVVNYLTVWIFPFETYYLGIKPIFRGSLLTAAHVLAAVLLAISWQYFWSRRAGSQAADKLVTPPSPD